VSPLSQNRPIPNRKFTENQLQTPPLSTEPYNKLPPKRCETTYSAALYPPTRAHRVSAPPQHLLTSEHLRFERIPTEIHRKSITNTTPFRQNHTTSSHSNAVRRPTALSRTRLHAYAEFQHHHSSFRRPNTSVSKESPTENSQKSNYKRHPFRHNYTTTFHPNAVKRPTALRRTRLHAYTEFQHHHSSFRRPNTSVSKESPPEITENRQFPSHIRAKILQAPFSDPTKNVHTATSHHGQYSHRNSAAAQQFS
jgi:hypothetical protein